jgi:hypothetical protein
MDIPYHLKVLVWEDEQGMKRYKYSGLDNGDAGEMCTAVSQMSQISS